MKRILLNALLGSAVLLASCAQSPNRDLPEVPKSVEWLCGVSFDFGEPIDVVYLGAGNTRDAAIAAARADCARRREGDDEKAICQTGRALAEDCSPPG